jgi:uncharacterized protein YkwD
LLCLESLEAREVLNFGPEGWDAVLYNLINQMRTDPQGELMRLLSSISPTKSDDPNINSSLQQYGVDGSILAAQWSNLRPVAPLTWSENLHNAAVVHNLAMIGADRQAHQVDGEPGLAQRVETAGYTPWAALGENVFAFALSVLHAHAAFAIDWGPGPGGIQDPPEHRLNIMDPNYRDVGVAVHTESDPNTQVGPFVVTEDFGRLQQPSYGYIVGAVYIDQNGNGCYDQGEGVGGVNVTVTRDGQAPMNVPTWGSGNYQIAVPPGAYTLTFTGWPLMAPVVRHVIVAEDNILVNLRLTAALEPADTNHAPELPPGMTTALPGLLEDVPNPQGISLHDLLGDNYVDADPDARHGIAVFATSPVEQGFWQYSVDQGRSWLNLENVSLNSARLLKDTSLLRFLPAADYNGPASLSFRAWDGMVGKPGGTAYIYEVGGSTAFSLHEATVTITVQNVNDAPVLNPAATANFAPTTSRPVSARGSSIAALLAAAVTDADQDARQGIAVFGTNGAVGGIWQFSLDGGNTWNNFGTVSTGRARLLRDHDWIRFLPQLGASGNVGLQFRAWDTTAGIAGGVANLTAVGGATAYSSSAGQATLRVNNAPRLAAGVFPTFDTILEGTTNPAGNFVAQIASAYITDFDLNQVKGIAIHGATDTTGGTWQFSLDGGQTWTNFGTVGPEQALLLRGKDKVRFLPQTGFFGSVSLHFRAWDGTTGLPGETAALHMPLSTGGATAFSASVAEAVLAVVPKYATGPSLLEAAQRLISPIITTAYTAQGEQVGRLAGLSRTDGDIPAGEGIAVIGLTGTGGVWQYSLNNGRTWLTLRAGSGSKALFLNATDRVRFVPTRNFRGQASLMFRSWNTNSGLLGAAADLSLLNSGSGITAFNTSWQVPTPPPAE